MEFPTRYIYINTIARYATKPIRFILVLHTSAMLTIHVVAHLVARKQGTLRNNIIDKNDNNKITMTTN